MLKVLLIVALVLGIVPYTHGERRSPASNPAQGHNPSNPTASTAPEEHRGSHFQEGTTTDQNTHEPKSVRVILPPKDNYDLWSFWIGAALAVVGFAGIGVGLRTLCLIKVQAREMRRQNKNIVKQTAVLERQTKATEDAASAALLNAQSLVNIERPWLFMELEHQKTFDENGDEQWFLISVRNKGRTAAEIISFSF